MQHPLTTAWRGSSRSSSPARPLSALPPFLPFGGIFKNPSSQGSKNLETPTSAVAAVGRGRLWLHFDMFKFDYAPPPRKSLMSQAALRRGQQATPGTVASQRPRARVAGCRRPRLRRAVGSNCDVGFFWLSRVAGSAWKPGCVNGCVLDRRPSSTGVWIEVQVRVKSLFQRQTWSLACGVKTMEDGDVEMAQEHSAEEAIYRENDGIVASRPYVNKQAVGEMRLLTAPIGEGAGR